jgi:hypothetical protein
MWARKRPSPALRSQYPSKREINGTATMELHLSNPELLHLLSGRCGKNKRTIAASPYQTISFTHIPKAGGTSVINYLHRYAPGRLRKGDHEHFLSAASAEPDSLFVTLLREPVSQAISFYSYAQDCPKYPDAERHNKLWQLTYKASPVEWSASPSVQQMLGRDPTGYFLRDVANITDSITRIDYDALQKLPPVHLRATKAEELTAFVKYAAVLPQRYQCAEHLEVAFILLKHYDVVGSLEHVEDFQRVLNQRAQIRDRGSQILHKNRSRYQWRSMAEKDRAAMEENLKEPLFCATVLWKIASMISDRDNQCLLE